MLKDLLPPLHGPSRLSEREISFIVWAPNAKKLQLKLGSKTPVEMTRLDRGYFSAVREASEGEKYFYFVNGKKRPDPASRYQPDGVHGPSGVSLSDYEWHDSAWKGIPRSDLIIYEIHVGTFSRKGTFESIIPYLPYLKDLGITAIELMPIAQFPGSRNWGYDGVDLFAAQNSYGGPRGLKKLVDSCHEKEISVLLDVVYNHLGPEGNYLGDFGPYFSYKYHTPWGPAVNYDERGSDEVRKFIIQNAVYWIEECHIDGLRLDAIDKIFDDSPRNMLLEIGENVHEAAAGREVHVIAESDLNDAKIIGPRETGGYAVDGQWADDFHHSVRAYLTGERTAFLSDFGDIRDIAKSLSSAFVYDGKYSVFRGRSHGAPAGGLAGDKFVYFLQNHDRVGNHLYSARLSTLLSFDKLKVAVALLLLSQSVPLLFMGEEYGEIAPFHYFVSHSEKNLIKAVREGRRKEHELEREFADPQAESTFLDSKLNRALKSRGNHKLILKYYWDLIRLRSSYPSLRNFQRSSQEVLLLEDRNAIIVRRSHDREEMTCVFVLGDSSVELEDLDGEKVFDSAAYGKNSVSMKISGRADTRHLEPFSATVFARKVTGINTTQK